MSGVESPSTGKATPPHPGVIIGLAAFLIVAIIGIIMGPEESDPREGATPSPSASPADPGDPLEGGAPVFGNTPAPNPTMTFEGTEDREYPDVPPPGFEPTSDREPAPGDAARAEALLDDVIPGWASNDTSGGNSMSQWSPGWESKEGIGARFSAQSRVDYQALWVGLSRMDASAKDARITSKKELWNVGSHSLWRVDVSRDIVSNHGQLGIDGEEQVKWDFLIQQDEGDTFQLVAFASPEKENEKPETFYLSRDLG